MLPKLEARNAGRCARASLHETVPACLQDWQAQAPRCDVCLGATNAECETTVLDSCSSLGLASGPIAVDFGLGDYAEPPTEFASGGGASAMPASARAPAAT
jgi:hypothetical protein